MRRLILVAIFLAGCAKSDATAPSQPATPVAGNYVLTYVDGSPLPATVSVNGTSFTYTSGTLAVASSTFQFTVCSQNAGAQSACGSGFQSTVGSGQWSEPSSGDILFVEANSSSSVAATYNAGALTLPFGSGALPQGAAVNFTFTKQ